MAQIIARIDFYDPKWESKEMVDVFQNGTDEQKHDWMIDNCKCKEIENVDIGKLFYYDEKLVDNEKYFIYYVDLGIIEEVVLVYYG